MPELRPTHGRRGRAEPIAGRGALAGEEPSLPAPTSSGLRVPGSALALRGAGATLQPWPVTGVRGQVPSPGGCAAGAGLPSVTAGRPGRRASEPPAPLRSLCLCQGGGNVRITALGLREPGLGQQPWSCRALTTPVFSLAVRARGLLPLPLVRVRCFPGEVEEGDSRRAGFPGK